MMAIAIQPAMPRSAQAHPVSVASANKTLVVGKPSGKENLNLFRASGLGNTTPVRTRRERPCDACRRRKSRCVINEGAILCVLCEFHKQDCTFVQDPQPRKRKLVTGDDKKEGTPKKRSIDLISAVHKTASIKTAGRPQISSTHRPVNTRLQHHVLGETLGLQSHQHSRHVGLTTPFDTTLISLSIFNSRNESMLDIGTLRRVNEHETFMILADDAVTDAGDDTETLDVIEGIVAPHGPALVELYFRIVHPSFPIIQKKVFLERVRTGDRNFAPALLAGIYILALNWWAHDSSLASKTKPDVTQLEVLAQKALNAAMLRPKLSTVQAGLLLLQRPEADSWSLTTQLVAIGQEIGLHLDCSSWTIPLWERELRKRIAWALYMQDKWSSLIHGRPSHIFAANWAVRPMSTENTALEEAEINNNITVVAESEESKADMEKGLVLFSQMIGLTSIMAEVMDTFYTQVAIADFANAGRNSTSLILQRAKPVQMKLKEWYARLPSEVRMESLVPGRLSSTGFIHLAYFATEITLHRRIVQSLSATSEPYLTHICRSAAKTRLISAMDFVNRLKPEQLQSFWYFPSKINFTLIGTFGGLLWATAPAREEADFYKARLREYRWTLSVSSKRASFLGFAVQMLDTSRTMLNNLAEKPSLADSVSSAGVPAPETAMQLDSPGEEQTQLQQVDVVMDDSTASPSLTRNTSVSAFSGFSDTMERDNNPTPPSSVGG